MGAAIQVEQLGKRYARRTQAEPTLIAAMRHLLSRRATEDFWALREVSFDIPAGQTVGVIGPNGSGKSSLLGLVAGTITPTEGIGPHARAHRPRCWSWARASTPT
jgi:ABC-type polysaccharide/polyol phosphate transport system ATPase subunit